MVTYVQTAYNQFESPSGAVGEPPDGPGGFKHLADQLDARLSFGGAEYCANAAAMTAIPASRAFKGKLAYRADLDTVFRYVGGGNTALGSTNGSAWWQAWEKPPAIYTPTWANLTGVNATGIWGISAGYAWCAIDAVSASGYLITGGTDVTASIPTPMVWNFAMGRGLYYRGGSTSNTTIWDLIAFAPVTGISTGTSFRIRAVVQNGTAPGATTVATVLGNAVPSPYTADRFTIECRAPSGLVA